MNPQIAVDSTVTAEVRDACAIGERNVLDSINPAGFSLAAVTELACLKECYPFTEAAIEPWERRCPILNDAIEALSLGRMPSLQNMWQSRYIEFFPLRGRNWNEARFYHPYESRFVKAAKEHGFGAKADALAGALFEMSDNVVQHGAEGGALPPKGVIGYHVEEGRLTFAVADVGRGVLASLLSSCIVYATIVLIENAFSSF